MALHYRTPALILKNIHFREADEFLVVFTKKFGKIEILGKALRKITSKLRGNSNPFQVSEIEFVQGKNFKTLTDTFLIENFPGIKKDLGKLAIAFRISEMLHSLLRIEEKDEKIWQFIVEGFRKLNFLTPQILSYQLFFYYFTWNLFSLLGYKPELYLCSFCQRKLVPPNLYFNFREGGIICQDCFKGIREGEKISSEIVKILRFFLEKEWKMISRLKIKGQYFPSLKKISHYWIRFLPKPSTPFLY